MITDMTTAQLKTRTRISMRKPFRSPVAYDWVPLRLWLYDHSTGLVEVRQRSGGGSVGGSTVSRKGCGPQWHESKRLPTSRPRALEHHVKNRWRLVLEYPVH